MATVIISGGSRGIGAAAVDLFVQRGDRVFFLYEKEHEAAHAVSQRTGATAICCDVADADAVAAAFRQIGDADILICNAGISISGLINQTTQAQWNRLFDVNVKGMYHCINAALPYLLKKKKVHA